MKDKKTSVFENGLIWFGAAVSIAEILAGTLFAPLGLIKGITAILIGHVIGCALLYFAGLIGAKYSISAMETVKISFGKKGSTLFSSLNVLQLIGWTAIMIVVGANSAQLILPFGVGWLWSVVIGALILVWVLIGVKNLSRLNMVAMAGLFVLTVILCAVVFRGRMTPVIGGGITFGQAVELSAAMPLSWLPLISDYTRFAKKKTAATAVSAAVYFVASSWMYLIGLGSALFTANSDIAQILLNAGLGIAGLLTVIFSTVTTAYLDAFSAGVSAVSIVRRLDEKWTAAAVCVIGTLLAIVAPITQFENFLYLIGSVFAPMIAILIVDVFILKNDASQSAFNVKNLILWAVGFAVYRLSLTIDTPVGNTLPVMIITALLCLFVNKIGGLINARNNA